MMSLDPINNLNQWPMPGLDEFIEQCIQKNVTDINVTGTNTDPLLYKHMWKLKNVLQSKIPDLKFGIRTNGVLFESKPEIVQLFDKGSITICSLDSDIYKKMMGNGSVPDIWKIANLAFSLGWNDIKINIVLGPENLEDLSNTLKKLSTVEGLYRVNLREPYGQSRIGNPFGTKAPDYLTMGMPTYIIDNLDVTYWDVHYVEVESVNLYANGHVSKTYPITLGHDPINGKVLDQSNFGRGRHQKQWLKVLQ